jgi:hypothetical protein
MMDNLWGDLLEDILAKNCLLRRIPPVLAFSGSISSSGRSGDDQ